MSSHPFRCSMNVFFFLIMVVINIFASSLPLFGRSTAEVSAMAENLLTPAGYAFIIWSVIYVLLAIWVVSQCVPRIGSKPEFKVVGGLFILSSILNVLWLVLWHALYFYTTLPVMVALLVTLIVLYRRVRQITPRSWIASVPFSIYLGWISVATIQNVAVVLTRAFPGKTGLGIDIVAAIVLLVGTGIALAMLLKQRDGLYPLVFVWAYVAIAVKSASSIVDVTSFTLAALIFIFTIAQFARGRISF
ncbi:tryptophan-rich sensory protein [Litoribacterium kuwaitense]|uniref:tryptophan-rich sensory protein n=1 Tax=Litoribacterium kuwaitense TaxID=1398745 RepID=UPI0035E40C94